MSMEDQRIDEIRYKVIPRALIFLFDELERVLLLKGSKSKKLWAGLYNGVGGHVEVGEDIHQAACRELREETGLEGIELQLCGQIMVDGPAGIGVAIFIFKGFCTADASTLMNPNEGKLHWLNMNALPHLPIVEDLPILLPKIFQYKLGEPIIIARYTYSKDGKLQILFR